MHGNRVHIHQGRGAKTEKSPGLTEKEFALFSTFLSPSGDLPPVSNWQSLATTGTLTGAAEAHAEGGRGCGGRTICSFFVALVLNRPTRARPGRCFASSCLEPAVKRSRSALERSK